MCVNVVLVATALLGIEAGWKPLPEGGVEYHIQIEPHVLEALKSGEAIYSDVPPHVRNVRAYKITVGTEEGLPRELPVDVDTTGAESGGGVEEQRASPPDPDEQTGASETFPAAEVSPEVSLEIPGLLPPGDPGGKPISAQPAVHLELVDETPDVEQKSGGGKQAGAKPAATPWLRVSSSSASAKMCCSSSCSFISEGR